MSTPNSSDDALNRRQFLSTAGAVTVGMALSANQGVAISPTGLDICFMNAVDLAASLREKELARMPPEQRKQIKKSVQWDASQGEKLTGMDVAMAETKRARIFQSVNKFLEKYEFLVLPVTQVAPFPVETEYPTEINGKKMNSYLEWMEIVYAITLTGMPAISVPCAFTPAGMPVGLQIVGRRQNDLGVLQLAHAFEKAAKVSRPRVPLL